jgi:hypothetical protein
MFARGIAALTCRAARAWQGELPHGLSFEQNNVQVVEMLGEPHNKGGNNVPVWIEVSFPKVSVELASVTLTRRWCSTKTRASKSISRASRLRTGLTPLHPSPYSLPTPPPQRLVRMPRKEEFVNRHKSQFDTIT